MSGIIAHLSSLCPSPTTDTLSVDRLFEYTLKDLVLISSSAFGCPHAVSPLADGLHPGVRWQYDLEL